MFSRNIHYFIKLLCILLILIQLTVADTDKSSNQPGGNNVFIPSNEWQTISPEQAVPTGLHIQVNMGTGERQAKLADINDDTVHDMTQLTVSESHNRHANNMDTVNLHINDDILNQHRLKQLSTNSDTYTTQQLLSLIVHEAATHDIVLSALELLDDKVSDIDVSKHFVDMHGFLPIIAILDTRYTDDMNDIQLNNLVQLQLQSIKVISSLAQNNPYVKSHMYHQQYINNIIPYIDVPHNDGISTSAKLQLLHRALTCISVLIDNDSNLQQQFNASNGWKYVYALHSYINDIYAGGTVDQSQLHKLTNRLLNIQYDLLFNDSIHNHIANNQLHHTWCSIIDQQFSTPVYNRHTDSVTQLKQLYNTQCYAYS